jgi:hypothetical protein
MDTRLILVEGCPGSGKSSTAQFLCRQLQRAGHECRWYYEEEQPHPVAATKGVHHAKGFREFGRSTLRRWRDFVARARRSKEIHIVESHFFQDVVTPLHRVNVKPTRIAKLVDRMAEFCEPLQPALLYFHQPDYAAAMRRLLDERGPRIEDLYIRRAETSPYGKRRGLQGFEGLVQSWMDARQVMEERFGELDLAKLSIDNTAADWDSYYRQIGEFLSLPLEPPAVVSEKALREYAGTYTYTRTLAPRRSAGRTRFGTQDVSRRVGGLPRQGPLHHEADVEFTIQLEDGELVLRDYGWLWPTNRLIPLDRDVFDLRSWPFQMAFERDAGVVVGARRKSETTRWQITGQRYPRLGETDDAEPARWQAHGER